MANTVDPESGESCSSWLELSETIYAAISGVMDNKKAYIEAIISLINPQKLMGFLKHAFVLSFLFLL